jgi:hypothetical protein
MVTESLLAQPKLVLTSCKNCSRQFGAWCIRRAKLLVCIVGALVILHLIHQMNLTTDQWRTVETDGFLAEPTTLAAWQKDEIIAESLPSLPYVAWKANKDQKWNLKCGKYPSIYDVSFFNTYWQTFKLQNYTIQIFGKIRIISGPLVTLFDIFRCKQAPIMTIDRYLAGSPSCGSTH